jgi:serine/threonine protein kinase
MMDNRIGQQLGNYRLLDLLGIGALTKVYLGKHIHIDILAAIKVLNTPLIEKSDIGVFQAEAHVAARLHHTNIVRILDFGVEDATAFFVATYVPHGTFPRNYPKGSRLLPITILPWVKQICSALQYAHNHHIVHRDIRPENILLGDNNEVLLDHFGSYLVPGLSENRWIDVGPLAYLAPEQIGGRVDLASDQYALGVVTYEWLCGKLPYEGTQMEILTQLLSDVPPPPLRKAIPTLSPAIEQVVLKALTKDPQQRFPSIQDFANAFERACSSEQTPVPASTEVLASQHSIKLFFSYSHKDEKLRNELAKRLTLLKRNGLITDWYDRNIDAGAEWAREADMRLNQADIILLLVSPDFIASDYCYNLEMARALERHQAGEASVIPIILRPVSWKETPFGKLQALPEGGKAVTTWSNRDQAFLHIAEGIQKIVEKSNKKRG